MLDIRVKIVASCAEITNSSLSCLHLFFNQELLILIMLGPNEHTLAWLGIDCSVLGWKIPTFYPKVMWNCKVFSQQSNIFSFAGTSVKANLRNFHR